MTHFKSVALRALEEYFGQHKLEKKIDLKQFYQN